MVDKKVIKTISPYIYRFNGFYIKQTLSLPTLVAWWTIEIYIYIYHFSLHLAYLRPPAVFPGGSKRASFLKDLTRSRRIFREMEAIMAGVVFHTNFVKKRTQQSETSKFGGCCFIFFVLTKKLMFFNLMSSKYMFVSFSSNQLAWFESRSRLGVHFRNESGNISAGKRPSELVNLEKKCLVGGFNPTWKILVKKGIFPKWGVKIEHIWNHHLIVKVFNQTLWERKKPGTSATFFCTPWLYLVK